MLLLLLLGTALYLVSGNEEVTYGSSCPVRLPSSWEDPCALGINCPLENGYNHNINHPFLCENKTVLHWIYPTENGTINMKMWFPNKTGEYRLCNNDRPNREGPYTFEFYNDQDSNPNGPILAGNILRRAAEVETEVRRPCAVSSWGYVKFRMTSDFSGYLLPTSFTVLELDSPDEVPVNLPPATQICQAGDGFWTCEITIHDCPVDLPGSIEVMKPSDCDTVTLAWHYTWSTSLSVKTFLPGGSTDFRMCFNLASQAANLTHLGSGHSVSLPYDNDPPATPQICLDSTYGSLDFSLSVAETHYVVWFNVTYYTDSDPSGAMKTLPALTNHPVLAVSLIVYLCLEIFYLA